MFAPCQCQHTSRAVGAGLTASHPSLTASRRSLTADHSDAVGWALNSYHSRAVAATERT
jgi:hypothetical protein